MKHSEAIKIAEEIRELLRPACERIEIAGSLRRMKPDVGDIELVCIPLAGVNILGERVNESGPLCDLINAQGWPVVKKGEKYKRFTVGEIDVDLFICDPQTWGVIYTLRTGGAEFSHQLVTPRKFGGLMPSFLNFKDGRIWHGRQALETPQEKDVFSALSLHYIPPESRSAEHASWWKTRIK